MGSKQAPPAGEMVGGMSKKELEWKAAWWHQAWMEQKAGQGWHAPAYHANPQLTPMRLREDGKTYCNFCSPSMVPYDKLPEDVKDSDRLIVLNGSRCQAAWEVANGR